MLCSLSESAHLVKKNLKSSHRLFASLVFEHDEKKKINTSRYKDVWQSLTKGEITQAKKNLDAFFPVAMQFDVVKKIYRRNTLLEAKPEQKSLNEIIHTFLTEYFPEENQLEEANQHWSNIVAKYVRNDAINVACFTDLDSLNNFFLDFSVSLRNCVNNEQLAAQSSLLGSLLTTSFVGLMKQHEDFSFSGLEDCIYEFLVATKDLRNPGLAHKLFGLIQNLEIDGQSKDLLLNRQACEALIHTYAYGDYSSDLVKEKIWQQLNKTEYEKHYAKLFRIERLTDAEQLNKYAQRFTFANRKKKILSVLNYVTKHKKADTALYNYALECLGYSQAQYKDLKYLLLSMRDNGIVPNMSTYTPLLKSARWDDLIRILQRNILFFDSTCTSTNILTGEIRKESADEFEKMWCQLFESLTLSVTETYASDHLYAPEKSKRYYGMAFQILQKSKKKYQNFSAVFDRQDFRSAQLTAASVCGLFDHVLDLLDDIQHLTTEHNLQMLIESTRAIPSFMDNILTISFDQLEQIKGEVCSDEVEEMMDLVSREKNLLKDMENSSYSSKEELMLVIEAQKEVHLQECYRHLVVGYMSEMDDFVNNLVQRMDEYGDEEKLEVYMNIMRQYMNCATRYDRKIFNSSLMGQNTAEIKHYRNELSKRSFALLEILMQNFDPAMVRKNPNIQKCLSYFFRLQVVLFDVENAEMALKWKNKILDLADNDKNLEEYDLLIYLYCSRSLFSKAKELLMEMHNKGLSPSQDTIHRMVVCQMKHLSDLKEKDEKRRNMVLNDSSYVENENEEEKKEPEALTELQVVDVIDFIGEWYNFYRIKPYGKTLLPLVSYLIEEKNVHELNRLNSMLMGMDLPRATQLWFKKYMTR